MEDKNKKRILYIVTKSVWAGAGKYVYDLAANLPKERFFVAAAAGGQDELKQKLEKAGIEYFEIKNFQKSVNPFKDALAIFEILKIIKNFKPSVVHVNSSKAGGLVGIAAFIYKISKPKTNNFELKTVFTAHGWAFNESRPQWQLFLIKFLSLLTAKFYNKIICVSEYDRITALKNQIAAPQKLLTIHNGIDPNEQNFLSKTEARTSLSKMMGAIIKNDDIVIGNIGEFTKNKNQSVLIDAIKILMTGGFPLTAVFIGWGEEKKNLETRIKNLELGVNIFLAENIFPASPYLKAFDVFVLPSLKEGLPYVLLEAGLAGLPVIASDAGGIPEIISNDDLGILYNEQSPKILADKISNLINNKSQREILGKNLKNEVIKNFNLQNMAKKTLQLYQ